MRSQHHCSHRCLRIFLVIMAILVNTTALGEITWLRVLFGVSALNFTLRATIPLGAGRALRHSL